MPCSGVSKAKAWDLSVITFRASVAVWDWGFGSGGCVMERTLKGLEGWGGQRELDSFHGVGWAEQRVCGILWGPARETSIPCMCGHAVSKPQHLALTLPVPALVWKSARGEN